MVGVLRDTEYDDVKVVNAVGRDIEPDRVNDSNIVCEFVPDDANDGECDLLPRNTRGHSEAASCAMYVDEASGMFNSDVAFVTSVVFR